MKTLNMHPKKEMLSLLANIEGKCEVYVFKPTSALTGLYIFLNQNMTLRVDVKYTDVIFKFECFSLDFQEIKDFLPDSKYTKICDVSFKEIKTYVRYGWERPFLPGEENSYNSETIIEVGKKKDIPTSAVAMCSSLTGMVFFDDLQKPILLIAHDINSTVEMIISQDYQDIISYIGKHEEFSLEDRDEEK